MNSWATRGILGRVTVSVIVVSYNVRELLDECLSSIPLSEQVEAIVVDNASSDDSAELVRAKHPGCVLLALEANMGFSVAVNRGVARAHGELILLLNPDASLPNGSLEEMLAVMTQRPELAALGVRQQDQNGFFQLAVGPGPSLIAELGRKLIQGRLDRGSRLTARMVERFLSQPVEVPWVAASCLLVKREWFDRIDGFDEEFFLFFEDIDFCLRLREAGGRVLYDPRITIVHRRGASAKKASELAERAYRQSQRRFWSKHRGSWASFMMRTYLKLRGR
ncbi:MAG: GT2 family glycosyltransferase [Planctomycetota bacterium]|jgi:GT2 family glycosyltransferase